MTFTLKIKSSIRVSFKMVLLAILCNLFSQNVIADMPYMPLSFDLKTVKEIYDEGEMVEFILTITNTDKTKTYPVVTPSSQNGGLKLIHLDIYDRAKNVFIKRAFENREMSMFIKSIGINGIVYLKPGEKITIPFYWNNHSQPNASYSKPASHHILNVPLFVGEYLVVANYSPKGVADSLYHFLQNTDEEQVPNKINFMGIGESAKCTLKIKKAPLGKILIQGVEYNCVQYHKDDYYHYYADSASQKSYNPTHAVSTNIGSYNVINYEYSSYINLYNEYIKRFSNGNIQEYRRFGNSCPSPIFERRFNDSGILVYAADKLHYGSVKIIHYYEDQKILKEEFYSADAKLLTITEFIYNKTGGLRRKEITQRIDPCIVYLLDEKEKAVPE
jgi:hypothetical protein